MIRPSSHFDVPPQNVSVMGMPLAAIDSQQLLAVIGASIKEGQGGWVVTANLDILQHFTTDEAARAVYLAADIRIADGMPLLWAARAQGDRLPERVAGATFSGDLIAEAARNGWRVFLLGGAPGSAERAAQKLRQLHEKLEVAACSGLEFSNPPTPVEVDAARRLVMTQASQIVLVGLGSPKQEFLIQALRPSLPQAWYVGVGGTFGFLAGDIRRAPRSLQRVGLEWAYRLALEPRRLARRYLRRNLPFAAKVIATSALRRLRL